MYISVCIVLGMGLNFVNTDPAIHTDRMEPKYVLKVKLTQYSIQIFSQQKSYFNFIIRELRLIYAQYCNIKVALFISLCVQGQSYADSKAVAAGWGK